MSFITKLDEAIEKVEAQIGATQTELVELEKELSDQKLNPYGITNIDFSKRLELMEDLKKMEGAVMGLNLAKEAYAESTETA